MTHPGPDDLCATCKHKFSRHYQTFSKIPQFGCLGSGAQRDDACFCTGFAILWTEPS